MGEEEEDWSKLPFLYQSWEAPNFGPRRPFEVFKKRKMIRIEFPKLLAWFQTPQTVSRPSRPSSHTKFGTRRRIEIFKKRKMIRIEFPKAVVFAPFGRGLRVIGGWRETYFWDVCSTV